MTKLFFSPSRKECLKPTPRSPFSTLATHSPDNAKRFRALVNRVDDIQEAYSLTGDADYLLKAVLRDLKSLSDIVNNVLMPHQSVAHVRSSIVLDRLKQNSRLPLKGVTH
jgi:DNA-binding Lrp family transcriptional regulator